MNMRPRRRNCSLKVALLQVFLMALLMGGVAPHLAAADGRIVIFHTNDVHGKIDNFAKVAALLEAERKTGADVFFLSAGDNFTGNPIIDQYDPPGEPLLDLLNRLGTDLMCLGNHEFDYGYEVLKRFAARAKFPLVSANIIVKEGDFPQLKPAKVLTTAQGLKIAVFGLIQLEPGSGLPSTHPDKIKGLGFVDPLKRAMEMKSLRHESTVFIALTHIGYDQDIKLAEMMPELDVIVGGHSHTKLDPAETVNGVLIGQTSGDNRYLGRIELTVKEGRIVEKRGELIDLRPAMPEKAEIRALIDRFNDNPVFLKVFVEAPFEITGKDALGCLMSDAMCRVHGLDLAFQNRGGIRTSHLPSKINLKEVYTLDPFNNQVVVMELDAAEIRALIAHSFLRDMDIDLVPSSSIRYTVKVLGEKNIDVRLSTPDGAPLPENRSYRVGMSSYVASSYDFAHRDPGKALGGTTAEALIQFLKTGPDWAIYRTIRTAFRDPPRTADEN